MTLDPNSPSVVVGVRLTEHDLAAADELARTEGVRRSDIIRRGVALVTDPTELAAEVAVRLVSHQTR